jgi:hypothetical protein
MIRYVSAQVTGKSGAAYWFSLRILVHAGALARRSSAARARNRLNGFRFWGLRGAPG